MKFLDMFYRLYLFQLHQIEKPSKNNKAREKSSFQLQKF